MPQNAKLHMGPNLSALVANCSGKIDDLNGAHGFRLLLKKKSAEYRKILGKDPDPIQQMRVSGMSRIRIRGRSA